MECVCALPADLHGRDSGNGQFDGASKAVESNLQVVLGGRLVVIDPLALDVAGRRLRGEVDLGLVPLRQADELRLQPGRGARQEKQEPGRERVECPRMPRPGPRLPPQCSDDRERRRAGGLVDEDDSTRL
jgi:hypothetical protein